MKQRELECDTCEGRGRAGHYSDSSDEAEVEYDWCQDCYGSGMAIKELVATLVKQGGGFEEIGLQRWMITADLPDSIAPKRNTAHLEVVCFHEGLIGALKRAVAFSAPEVE